MEIPFTFIRNANRRPPHAVDSDTIPSFYLSLETQL